MTSRAELEKRIETLEKELFWLKLSQFGTPEEALAIMIHRHDCKMIHNADGCGWDFVGWDLEPRKAYLTQAMELLCCADILVVLNVLKAYTGTPFHD